MARRSVSKRSANVNRRESSASNASAAAPFKACKCGRDYSRQEWERLPFRGSLEFRDCACGSTISIHIPAEPRAGER